MSNQYPVFISSSGTYSFEEVIQGPQGIAGTSGSGGTTYTAGVGISISSSNVISATDITYESLTDSTTVDLTTLNTPLSTKISEITANVSAKQDALTAGTNITIVSDVISVSGLTYSEITDGTTASLPTLNTPLATALAARKIPNFYTVGNKSIVKGTSTITNNGYMYGGDTSGTSTLGIQEAINAAAAAGGGTIFFESGIYDLSSTAWSLHSNSTYYSKIVLPNVSVSSAPYALQLVGAGTVLAYNFLNGNNLLSNHSQPVPTEGVIFYNNATTNIGSSTGVTYAIMAFDGYDTTNSALNESQIGLIMKNITFRQDVTAGYFTSLDIYYCSNYSLENIVFDVNAPSMSVIAGTITTMIALHTPAPGNGMQTIRNIFVTGYYIAIINGDHLTIYNAFIQLCAIGFQYIAANHGLYIYKILFQNVGRFFRSTASSKVYINVTGVDIEDFTLDSSNKPTSTAGYTTYHIDDVNQSIYGTIRDINMQFDAAGTSYRWIRNGGNNVTLSFIPSNEPGVNLTTWYNATAGSSIDITSTALTTSSYIINQNNVDVQVCLPLYTSSTGTQNIASGYIRYTDLSSNQLVAQCVVGASSTAPNYMYIIVPTGGYLYVTGTSVTAGTAMCRMLNA